MKRRIEDEKEELQQTINRFPLFLIMVMMMVIIIMLKTNMMVMVMEDQEKEELQQTFNSFPFLSFPLQKSRLGKRKASGDQRALVVIIRLKLRR